MNTETKLWWTAEEKQQHEGVMAQVKALRSANSELHEENKLYASLYGAAELLGLGLQTFKTNKASQRVTYNVIRSMCDTANAKTAKNKPRPMFLTTGGDYKMQRRARDLGKFVAGVFHAGKIYEVGKQVQLDSAAVPLGVMKVYVDEGRFVFERIFCDELEWDEDEARYGAPRSLFQCKFISREVLKAKYPKSAKLIDAAKPETELWRRSAKADATDQLLVVEAWHLPSGAKATDGRHVIACDGVTLHSESYERTCFPFVFLRWRPKMLGFRGNCISERQMTRQAAINKLLQRIQKAMEVMGTPWVFVEEGSKVVSSHLTNEIGVEIRYVGTPPIRDTSPPMNGEVLMWLQSQVQAAFEEEGISMLSAQSKKPEGLDSGKAIREYNDIESERFVLQGQDYEQFYMQAAEHVVELAKSEYARNKNLAVNVPGRKFIERIKWADVDMEKDQYEMQVFPTSFLPSTPAGKFQTVQEMVAAGMLTREQGMSLLDFPDLEAVNALINAPIEDIKAMIEDMLEDGKYAPPEPFQNLDLGISMCQSAYLKAKRDGVPEDRLELLRLWMEDAKAAIVASQPPPPMPAPMAPPMPVDPLAGSPPMPMIPPAA